MDYLIIIAVICAFIVKGLCGFANTLVFTTILSFKTDHISITPLELLVGYLSNLIIAWKSRHSISAKIYLPLSLLVIIGSIPGTIFLKNGNVQLIKIIFGFVIVFLGMEMLLREYRKRSYATSSLILSIIGITAGILCGLYGIGALLPAYVSRTTNDDASFKGNLCIVFLVENTFRIILYTVTGIININLLNDAFWLLPFMLLGLFIGIALSKVFKEKHVKKIVIIMLIFSGLSLILNNLIL